MLASLLLLVILAPEISDVNAFSPTILHLHTHKCNLPPHQSWRLARGVGFGDGDGVDDDDEDFVYAGRNAGREERSEGGYVDNKGGRASSPPSQSQDVAFFDLDDDDLFDDEYDGSDTMRGETYNGIIPNPLLDSIDPDGVYERLGTEAFRDWKFYRDMVFLVLFVTTFSHGLPFDPVVENVAQLPADFIK